MATPPAARPLQDWYCTKCNRFLMRLYLVAGSIVEHRCRHCKTMNVREAV